MANTGCANVIIKNRHTLYVVCDPSLVADWLFCFALVSPPTELPRALPSPRVRRQRTCFSSKSAPEVSQSAQPTPVDPGLASPQRTAQGEGGILGPGGRNVNDSYPLAGRSSPFNLGQLKVNVWFNCLVCVAADSAGLFSYLFALYLS